MTRPEPLDRQLVQDTREALSRLLDAVRRGDLTATGGMVARLEGAVWALDALLANDAGRLTRDV